MRIKVIPLVISTLGIITKKLVKELDDLDVRGQEEIIPAAA